MKVYLGKTEELTREKLMQASSTLSGHTLLNHFANQPAGTANYPTESPYGPSNFQATKVNVPVVPRQLVSRPRLTRQISTPLTLIYAPSGFGKSTLLNDWKQACGFPVAWLTLDAGNNQIKHFWYSVIMAMDTIDHQFGRELKEYLHNTTQVNAVEIVSRLVNDFTTLQKTCPSFGLVLDDFHRINHSDIYSSIQLLFEEIPAGIQLVIAGHNKPPFSLGHLRAKGMLSELDTNDLRFTLDEGIAYLKQFLADSRLSNDDLSKLVKRTEGWAAGLTLAALAFSKQENPHRFVDSFTGAHIYMREYFLETVLQRSSPEMQEFLLKTAILKNLTGKLCDAVTQQNNGDEMLMRLWNENLFIVRLEEEGWYRYHDLFAEMLLSQLKTSNPDEISQLHKRAAQWYREQLDSAEAIYHLMATEAWEEAALLIEETALRELEQFGEDSRLLRWLQELPETIVQKHKTLLFVYLRLAIVALPTRKITQYLARVESNLSNKQASQLTEDECAVKDEILQIRQTWKKGIPYIPPLHDGSTNETKWDLLNGIQLLRQGFGPVTSAWEKQVYTLLQNAQIQNNLFVLLMAGGILARRIFNEGQFRRSEKLARRVLEQALALLGKLPETASIALATISHIYLERNELDLAQKYLAQAMEVDPDPTSSNMLVQFAIQRIEIQIAQQNFDEALEISHYIRDLHLQRPSGASTDHDLLAYEALIHIRKGDILSAEQIMITVENISDTGLADLVRAKILLAKKQPEAAEEILDKLLSQDLNGIFSGPMMRMRILLARSFFDQHKINQALRLFKEALRLAEPEHFIRPFMEPDANCVPLLALALQTGNLPVEIQEFINEILQKTKTNKSEIKVSQAEIEALSRSASISQREQDILRLISAGYSNRQIASKFCLSVSTIKTHVGNIFCKLDVNNRTQAITVAKELKLV